MSRFAANALIAKSRAKYGRRLTPQNFREMSGLSCVADVAAYLKSKTHYAPVLQNIVESAVHRGNLEILLRNKLFQDYADLCHFEKYIGERFFEFLVLQEDINKLLTFLRYFIAGKQKEFLFFSPDFFTHETKIGDLSLSRVTDYDGLLEQLEGTVFNKLLRPFMPQPGRQVDYTMIEATLHKYLYGRIFKLIDDNFSGNTRKELDEIYRLRAELHNIRRIYRGKKYYQANTDLLRSEIIPVRRYLTKQKLEEILRAGDAEEVTNILRETPHSKMLRREDILYSVDLSGIGFYKMLSRRLRMSPSPAVVMVCCVMLFEYEIEDITNVIEGVRYRRSPDEIHALLVTPAGIKEV